MVATLSTTQAVGEANATRRTAGLAGLGYLAGTSEALSQRGFLESQWQDSVDAETAQAEDLRLGLVYLHSWPDLTGVPEELAPAVARVCALLSHKPTVGFLVAKVLDRPEAETRHILQRLQSLGHLRILQRRMGAETPAGSTPAAEPGSFAPVQHSAFLGKLWKRLVAR